MAGKSTLLKFVAALLVLSLFQVVETSKQKHAKARVASKKTAKLLPTKFHNDHDELMLADQATGSSYSYSYSYSSENDQSGGDISVLNNLELFNSDNMPAESGYSYSQSSEDDQSRRSATPDETEKSEKKIELEIVRTKDKSESEEENTKFEMSADESEDSRELEPSENKVEEVNAKESESTENTNELNAADEKTESNSGNESELTEDEIEIEILQKEAESPETTNELDTTLVKTETNIVENNGSENLLEEPNTSENKFGENEALSISGIETFDESGVFVDDSETSADNNNMETESMSGEFELMSNKWEKFLYEINMELSTDEAGMDIMSFDENDNQYDGNTLPLDDLLLEKTVSGEQLDSYSMTIV